MFDSVSINSARQFGHNVKFSVGLNFCGANRPATIALREDFA
jgi:hypothetical protein